MDIAGHVSMRMLRRYSHIQLEAKRAAIQALSNRPQNATSEGANVTKHVTKQGEGGMVPGQVIENNGRPERTRTVDLYRVNQQIIDFTTTYRRSQVLLTPLSACKFVQHRVGHRAGSRPFSPSIPHGNGERLLPTMNFVIGSVRCPREAGLPPSYSPSPGRPLSSVDPTTNCSNILQPRH